MTFKRTTVKPWSGRFSVPTDSFVEAFTESVTFDQRLYHYDIMASIAHVRMLAQVNVLTGKDADSIIEGLQAIEKQIEAGKFNWQTQLEDVHMNIETALVDQIGEVGKKIHTGRSRNDQIATDLRLYLRDETDVVVNLLIELMFVLVNIAEREAGTIMPGLTHLQTAQPVTFGHHMLAWFEMLKRDNQRMADCRKRINTMPLGSAALAGTSFPIDRQYTAGLLGFDSLSQNSLDAVSDRDFAVEFCSVVAIIMMHLSRFSEELVLWMSPQFGFIDIGDAWCTGSSIMPQKKNPDIPELVRGKTGRIYGDLISLLTLMKAQPLAYNRDNQEDKEALFDAIDTVTGCLTAYKGMLPEMEIKADVLRNAALKGYTTATDMADYLVRKGISFRDAHGIVAEVVHYAMQQEKELSALGLEELHQFSQEIDEDIYNYLELNGSVNARDHIGGTAPVQVRQAVKSAKGYLESLSE